MTRRKKRRSGKFLEKLEESGKWPQQACTTMFFLTPRNVTSERQIALMLIGTLQMAEMEELSAQCGKYCWDTERFKYRAGDEDLGAVALVQDLMKVFEPVGPPCGVGLGSKKDLAGAVRVLRAPEGGFSSKDAWQSRSRPSLPSCQGQSGVACFYVLCYRMH